MSSSGLNFEELFQEKMDEFRQSIEESFAAQYEGYEVAIESAVKLLRQTVGVFKELGLSSRQMAILNERWLSLPEWVDLSERLAVMELDPIFDDEDDEEEQEDDEQSAPVDEEIVEGEETNEEVVEEEASKSEDTPATLTEEK